MNSIRVTESADKKMKQIYTSDKKMYLKVLEAMEKLAEINSPKDFGSISPKNIKKLRKGILTREGIINENLYVFRISRSLRMIFTFSAEDQEVNVLEFVDLAKQDF